MSEFIRLFRGDRPRKRTGVNPDLDPTAGPDHSAKPLDERRYFPTGQPEQPGKHGLGHKLAQRERGDRGYLGEYVDEKKDGKRELKPKACPEVLGFAYPTWKKWSILSVIFAVRLGSFTS